MHVCELYIYINRLYLVLILFEICVYIVCGIQEDDLFGFGHSSV